MNATFKVGLMAILTVVTVLGGVLFIWQINPYANYQLYGYFPHVGGIRNGSNVSLMGVKIGEIMAIEPEPAKRRVKVTMNINRDVQLPVGSTFTIVTTGLVGDKALEILPPETDSDAFLKTGDMVQGNPPASMDAIFTEAQEMLKSARALVENQGLRDDILNTVTTVNRSAQQMEGLFKDIRVVTKGFGTLTTQTDQLLRQLNGATATTIPEIRSIVASTGRIANNMEALSAQVNALARDPEMLRSARGTLTNVEELTGRWNQLTEDMRTLTQDVSGVTDDVRDIAKDVKEISGDPEIKSNIKTVAKNATRLTESIIDFTTPKLPGENNLNINFRAEALGAGRLSQDLKFSPGAMGNFNIFGDLGLGALSYFRVGLDEIGDRNLINLQLGSNLTDSNSTIRFGIVRGKLGAGTDFQLTAFDRPLTLSGELYDINSPTMRLGVLQDLFDDYGISMYWDNQFVKGINEFNIGFRWQPKSESPAKLP